MNKTRKVRIKSCFVAIIFIAIAIAWPASGQVRTGGLPNLGDGEDMSVAAERRLGQRIAREIYREPDYLDDPVLGDYLQTIWQPLLASARARGELSPELDERFAFTPFLVRDRSVNAFALPGGYLGVHLGLITLVSSRDELASVLGHELSHVTQRHIARMASKQAQQTPWVIGAMILGMLAASKSPDAANAAFAGSQALAQQSQLNFSRDMEREADRIGFSVMTGAGFDGQGFASMFDKLQHANRINDNGSFPYLRSHPLTTERIADAQLRLPVDRAAQPAPLQMEPLLMSARAKVLADPGVDALRAWVAEAGPPTASGSTPVLDALPPARRAAVVYAAILAKLRLKDASGLAPLLARLAALTAPDADASRSASLLAAEVALAQDDPQRALLVLPPGGSRAAVLLAAQAQSRLGSPEMLEQAASALQTRVAVQPADALAWQMLANVYGRQGHQARAIRADAESRLAQLDYAAATDRLKAAQALLRSNGSRSPADNIEASIIDTRARQVELLLREQALER